jgi:hypothetical protein
MDMILRRVEVFGAVRARDDYRGNCRTVVDGSDRRFCDYTQAENMMISSSIQ